MTRGRFFLRKRLGCALGVVAAVAVPICSEALDPARRLAQYSARVWQDELPQSSVHTILQSSDGFIWFGTYEGLVRFDGVRFVVFHADFGSELAGGTVLHLREDEAGRLWVATNGGLSVLEDRRFRSLDENDGLPSSFVNGTAEDAAGRMWIGTNAGLAVMEEGRIRAVDDPQGPGQLPVRQVVVDRDGSVWAATDHGLFQYRGGGFTRYTSPGVLPDDSIRALEAGAAGVLWIGTNRGLVRRDAHGRFELFDRASGMPSETIRALYEDPRGVLWVGSEDRGLLRRLPDGSVSALGADEGLSHDYVRSLAEDREGALWVGTNGGLNQLRDAKFTSYTTLEGLSHNYVRTVFADADGGLWIGSDGGGLSHMDGATVRTWGTAEGLANDSVRSIERTRDGALWVGTRGGVSRFFNGRFENFGPESGLSDILVRVVYEDRDGRLWVGTEDGLNLWRDGRFEAFSTADGLVGNDVRALHQDRRGCLWVGTFSGVSCYRDGRFSNLTTENGLSADIVFAFFEDASGGLWIGTDHGLNHLREGRVESFGTSAGLFDNKVFCFLDDQLGSLWMSSNRGVTRVALEELNALAAGTRAQVSSESFGTADGMRTNQCNGASQPAGARSADGHLWFPTPRGLAEVDPARLQRNTLPPPVVVDAIAVDHGLVVRHGPARFPPRTENLELSYTGLSFQAPEKVYFRYRLVGYDRDWVEAGTRRTAFYTNLAPGRYRFEVTACNDDGLWNPQPAAFSFVLERAWWESYWAYGLYLICGVGLVVAVIRLRLSALERHAQLLERKVAERTAELDDKNAALAEKVRQLEISERNAHLSERRALEANRAKSVFLSNMSHELRTPLNSIIGFSSILANKLHQVDDEKLMRFVSNIHGSGEHLLGLINDLLDLSKIEAGRMELTLESFELGEVVDESCRVMHGVSHRRGITIHTEIPENLPPLTADRAKLKQVLFNLLSNAVKFSTNGSEVRVRAVELAAGDSPLAVDTIRVDVIDHGVGIERHHQELIFEEFRQVDGSASRQHEGTGLGLALVRRLLDLQGGTIRLVSTVGEGSTFSVFMPREVHHPERDALELPALVGSDSGSWPPVGARRTILVVEDDPVAYHQLARTLEAEGHRVIGARDGDEALRLVSERQPHLITLDLVLPGLDGWELLRELKADHQTCRIPVVIVTRKDSRELCLALGADDFFLKPVDRNQFLATATRLLVGDTELHEAPLILVIDDDPKLHELLEEALEEAGFRVVSALDGREGLEMVAEHHPDLVVLDLLMPGMSGFEVAHELRSAAHSLSLPIIVLTAKELSAAERASLADKIQLMLAKGADSPRRLCEAIRGLLARGGEPSAFEDDSQ